MRLGIAVHQEEPRTHCTSIGSDNGSKDFIPIPNGSCLACRGLCIPPWICLPRPSLTHHQTGHAEWCYKQRNVFHSFPRPFHVLSHVLRVNQLSVKSKGCQWQTCQFWCSMANVNRAPRCWAVSTGPTIGRHSWSLFLIVWSETFTPVACWRSFCRALAVLILFFLAQRSIYRSCWWVKDLLQSCPVQSCPGLSD